MNQASDFKYLEELQVQSRSRQPSLISKLGTDANYISQNEPSVNASVKMGVKRKKTFKIKHELQTLEQDYQDKIVEDDPVNSPEDQTVLDILSQEMNE